MKNHQKSAIVLLIVFLAALLPGCGKEKEKTPENSELSPYADSVVLKVNDSVVDYREAMLYFQAAKKEYEAVYGEDILSYVIGPEGETILDRLREKTLSEMIYQKLVTSQGKRLSIALDSEEKKAALDRVEEYMQQADYTTLAKYGIARKNVEQVYLDTALTQKIYDSVTLNVDIEISEEEAAQKHIQSLMLKNYNTDEKGNRTKLSVSELLLTLDRFDSLFQEAQTTRDFYSLAYANTDDKQYLDQWVGENELPFEFLAAYRLTTGESIQIKTEEGYYIFYCVTDYDADAVQKKKEELIRKRQDEEFQKLYEEFLSEAKIEKSEEILKAISEELSK